MSCVSSNRNTVALMAIFQSSDEEAGCITTSPGTLCVAIVQKLLRAIRFLSECSSSEVHLFSAPAMVKTFRRSSRHSIMPYDLEISIWNSL